MRRPPRLTEAPTNASPPEVVTASAAAEQIPELRQTFRFFAYERFGHDDKPNLLLRGAPQPDPGHIGWMTVSDAVVLIEPGADGVIFLDPSTILAESARQRRPRLSRPGVQTKSQIQPHPSEVIHVDSEVAVTFRPAWHNYFHWLTQYLPMALHSQEVFPDVEIIMPTYRSFVDRPIQPSFSEDTYRCSLEVVLGTERPPRFLKPGYYRFSSVRLPLFPQPSIFGHAFRDRFIQRFDSIVGSAESLADAGRGRRIFISRAGATNRSRVGAEIHNKFAKLALQAGYEETRLAELSWYDQIRTFAQTSHVVAIHGAGLSNLIFAKDATVIEYNQLVRGESQLRNTFFELSRDLGHRYYLIRDVDLDAVQPGHLADPASVASATTHRVLS